MLVITIQGTIFKNKKQTKKPPKNQKPTNIQP